MSSSTSSSSSKLSTSESGKVQRRCHISCQRRLIIVLRQELLVGCFTLVVVAVLPRARLVHQEGLAFGRFVDNPPATIMATILVILAVRGGCASSRMVVVVVVVRPCAYAGTREQVGPQKGRMSDPERHEAKVGARRRGKFGRHERVAGADHVVPVTEVGKGPVGRLVLVPAPDLGQKGVVVDNLNLVAVVASADVG